MHQVFIGINDKRFEAGNKRFKTHEKKFKRYDKLITRLKIVTAGGVCLLIGLGIIEWNTVKTFLPFF